MRPYSLDVSPRGDIAINGNQGGGMGDADTVSVIDLKAEPPRVRLLTCEHQTRRVSRTEYDGSITVILDQFEGKPLNSPNDIVCKADGSIWFTDPAFGPNPYEAMAKPELPGNVYCIVPNTKQATAVARERDRTVG